MLKTLNGAELATFIDGTSCLYMNSVYSASDDDDENLVEYSRLVLPDRIFFKLDSIEVGAGTYMDFDERLELFLKQLFARTPNLQSIEINGYGTRDDFQNIWDVLSCMEKPSMTIKNCKFSISARYDESRMQEVIFHLPMLTSLCIDDICYIKDLVAIVNTCLIHSKHLLSLDLEIPNELNNRKERAVFKKNIRLWLKENTLLGDIILGREFYAISDANIKIWL